MAAGESAVTSATMRPDNLVLIPKAFVGCRPNREYFSLEIGTGGRYALHPGVKCRDDGFVRRVRVWPGLWASPGRKESVSPGSPVIRSRIPDHAQDVLQLRLPKASLLR